MSPGYLPEFATDAFVSADSGKQDKIECIFQNFIGIGGETPDEINAVLDLVGNPPLDDGDFQRRDHCRTLFSKIFNRRTDNELRSQDMAIRSTALPIERNGQAEEILPPLFKGHCHWNYWAGRRRETPSPHCLTGTLVLTVNPTRFVRYHSVASPLPEGMQKPLVSAPPPFGERSLNGDDNFFPLSGRLYARLKPNLWRAHLERYFRGIEETFNAEVDRVCGLLGQSPHRVYRFQPRMPGNAKKYNLKVVETYFEWFHDDPVKLVADLAPFTKTFSSRLRREQAYLPEPFSEDDRDMPVVIVDTAPGERLKLYAKSNRRIRMEVIHRFQKKAKDRFQFPRERDRQGNIIRSSAHTFSSLEEVLQFLERLQRRAADIVNSFLRHVNNQSQVVPSHISGYRALLHVLRALPDDFSTAQEVTSILINGHGLSRGGSTPAMNRAIDALSRHGIIEMNGRQTRYVLTRNYRYPFKMLKEHANFSFLAKRAQGRSHGGSLFAGMD